MVTNVITVIGELREALLNFTFDNDASNKTAISCLDDGRRLVHWPKRSRNFNLKHPKIAEYYDHALLLWFENHGSDRAKSNGFKIYELDEMCDLIQNQIKSSSLQSDERYFLITEDDNKIEPDAGKMEFSASKFNDLNLSDEHTLLIEIIVDDAIQATNEKINRCIERSNAPAEKKHELMTETSGLRNRKNPKTKNECNDVAICSQDTPINNPDIENKDEKSSHIEEHVLKIETLLIVSEDKKELSDIKHDIENGLIPSDKPGTLNDIKYSVSRILTWVINIITWMAWYFHLGDVKEWNQYIIYIHLIVVFITVIPVWRGLPKIWKLREAIIVLCNDAVPIIAQNVTEVIGMYSLILTT